MIFELIQNQISDVSKLEGTFDLCKSLEILTAETTAVASYLCCSYVFTFAVNDNFLFIIDTHPLPSHSGGQMTGMILKTPKGNIDAVVQWMVNRIINSGSPVSFQSFNMATKLNR